MSRTWRTPPRLWLVVLAAAAALAVAIAAGRRPVVAPGASASVDATALDRAAQEQCRRADAARCQTVWRAARLRFLGLRP